MNLQTLLWIDLGCSIGLLIAVCLWPVAYVIGRDGWKLRRKGLTKFEREILRSRMDADSELEYDRITRALGIDAPARTPPQANVPALYHEVERRYHAKEIGLEQYKAEIRELDRVYPSQVGSLIWDRKGVR